MKADLLLLAAMLSASPASGAHEFCSAFVDLRLGETSDPIANQKLYAERPARIERCEKMVACQKQVDADPQTYELPIDRRAPAIRKCMGEEKA
jgi:hypothetical protein